MIPELKKFLESTLNTLEYCSFCKEIIFTPQDIYSLSTEQLTSLINTGLIKKYPYPKETWCNRCDNICDVEFKNGKKSLICLECGGHEKIDDTNSLKYFTGLSELSKFLQNILGLDNQIEIVEDNRLLYLGCKRRSKYYLLHRIRQSDSEKILENIKQPYVFILTLENNHNIQNSQIHNILDFLSFESNNFILDLPEITYTNSIASSGGKKKTSKYFVVRTFIIEEFNKEKALNPKKTMEVMCHDIAKKISKQFPQNLYNTPPKKPKEKKDQWLLKYDNLARYVQDTIRAIKK